MSDTQEDRLTDLEIRITHQEDMIDTLTDSLMRQQKIIDQLHGRLDQLQHRLRMMEEDQPADTPNTPEPPPPHY